MQFVKKCARAVVILLVVESAFVIHEYGHLKEFQKRGIPIQEFSLGIGWALYQHQSKEFVISFRAIPIAAYVVPTENGAKIVEDTFSTGSKFVIYSAGVRNNIAVAITLVMFFQILGWKRRNITSKELVRTMFFTPLKVALRYFAFLTDIVTVGRFKLGKRFCLSTGGINPPERIQQFIVWNLILGIFNLAPILPLDGGKITASVLMPVWMSLVANSAMETVLTVTNPILFFVFFLIANAQDWTLLEVKLNG